MLGQQIRAWEVLDDRVLEALEQTPRERFVPEDYRDLAFADTEIPLAHGQAMLAPKIEGRLLQALQVEPTDEVLEVGTGTGFLTACLALLAQRVYSVDIFPEFVESARAKLAAAGLGNVELGTADALQLDLPGRFDAIAVTGSMPALDDRFVRMLKPAGPLVRCRRPRARDGCQVDHVAADRRHDLAEPVRDGALTFDQRGATGAVRPLTEDAASPCPVSRSSRPRSSARAGRRPSAARA